MVFRCPWTEIGFREGGELNDPILKIKHQCVDIADNCDKSERQNESVINYQLITTDVEDTLESFIRIIDSLKANDSLVNTFLSHDVQYLWSDKYKLHPPRVLHNPTTTMRCLPVYENYRDL
ncbi:unnamed protein product [Rotaria sp. Silwood2]|nr:unnamed protein product [Rotaria sp. Silwood2]